MTKLKMVNRVRNEIGDMSNELTRDQAFCCCELRRHEYRAAPLGRRCGRVVLARAARTVYDETASYMFRGSRTTPLGHRRNRVLLARTTGTAYHETAKLRQQ